MAEDKNLIRQLGALGFSLFEAEKEADANAVLAEVVKSRNLRFWEGFPVMLANTAEKGLFDYDKIKAYLKEDTAKSSLFSLILVSLALYKMLGLKFAWAAKFRNNLAVDAKSKFDDFLGKIKNDEDFDIAGRKISAQRLKNTFNNYYFSQSQLKLDELLSMKEELNLEYVLSQVFSPKQKELFLKKLKGSKLTKTEREYFSRTVRKKVLALANSQLHRLAKKLL